MARFGRDNEEAPEGPNGRDELFGRDHARGVWRQLLLPVVLPQLEMLPAVPRPGDFQRRWWITGLIVDIVPPFGSKDSEATMLAR